MLDNVLVTVLMSLPFLIFLGLRYQTYRKQKKMEVAEEINSILYKHSHSHHQLKHVLEQKLDDKTDKNKAA
jgi:hypothetical protein